MAGSVEMRLEAGGVDLDFLAWLEGTEERLPRIDRIKGIRREEWVTAIQAAVWLTQHFACPEWIAPDKPEDWLSRYNLLQRFLWGALNTSMIGRAMRRHKDLQILDNILTRLLPPENRRQYQEDIRRLRRHRQPLWIPKYKARPAGGRRESEQTGRMRAAVEYLAQYSQAPYADLADFWNERLAVKKYHANGIYNRLCKGLAAKLGASPPAGFHHLDFWHTVYSGDFRVVFPGPFPLHPKLAERLPHAPTASDAHEPGAPPTSAPAPAAPRP